MTTITFTVTCHCGEDAKQRVTFTNIGATDPIVIDVDLSLGQSSFYCDHCGCTYYTGDFETYSDDEDACGGDELELDDEAEEIEP